MTLSEFKQKHNCSPCDFEKVPGFVYMIGEVPNTMQCVKIGFSKDPFHRVQENTMNPRKLILMDWFPATLETESRIHQKCSKHHIRGEWYENCVYVKAVFQSEKEVSIQSNVIHVESYQYKLANDTNIIVKPKKLWSKSYF